MGTGLNCTKTKLHAVTKLHEGTQLHEGIKLLEEDFAPRVNFAQVTFLHASKKIKKKNKT